MCRQDKKFELYTFLYDNDEFLPYFLQYYSFVNKMTFIDIGASKKTLSLVNNNTIIKMDEPSVKNASNLKNLLWKESCFDLVLFPDLDEILYIEEGLENFLRKTSFDLYGAIGYNMVVQNSCPIDSITHGARSVWHDKTLIFNPKIDIRFGYGAHNSTYNTNNVDLTSLKLLHYNWIGVEHVLKRQRLLQDSKYGSQFRHIVHKTKSEIVDTINTLMDDSICLL